MGLSRHGSPVPQTLHPPFVSSAPWSRLLIPVELLGQDLGALLGVRLGPHGSLLDGLVQLLVHGLRHQVDAYGSRSEVGVGEGVGFPTQKNQRKHAGELLWWFAWDSLGKEKT